MSFLCSECTIPYQRAMEPVEDCCLEFQLIIQMCYSRNVGFVLSVDKLSKLRQFMCNLCVVQSLSTWPCIFVASSQ
jgi:hypothetical protein